MAQVRVAGKDLCFARNDDAKELRQVGDVVYGLRAAAISTHNRASCANPRSIEVQCLLGVWVRNVRGEQKNLQTTGQVSLASCHGSISLDSSSGLAGKMEFSSTSNIAHPTKVREFANRSKVSLGKGVLPLVD